MGRKKIAIEKIDDPKKRIVTFSKRRGGIERKAAELCKLFADIIVCIIVFSPAGKAFTFSNSPRGVCNVVERFVEEQKKDKIQENKNVRESKSSTQCRNMAGAGSGSDSYWWDTIDMEKLCSVEKLKAERETYCIIDSIAVEDSITEDTIVEDEKHNLGLNLGWQLNEKATTSLLENDEEKPPLLTRGCRYLVEPCQSHPLTELTLYI
ncbi:hypothetical protein MKX03_024368 [Papaver bracteatum]|nr:hypothetical protein MKX03_024368 [Papaver bracteatum]